MVAAKVGDWEVVATVEATVEVARVVVKAAAVKEGATAEAVTEGARVEATEECRLRAVSEAWHSQ